MPCHAAKGILREAKDANLMGKLKGTKAAMLRQMGDRGELRPRLPAKVERKTPVKATPELLREACDRFAAGETLTAICLDEHMPTRQSLYLFSLTDPRHEEMWATAKAMHAERLMEDILTIADTDMKGPNGLVDNGQVQRDRLRVEVRHLRAAALDPARWGKQSTQTLVGDPDRPLTMKTTLAPVEVTLGIRALLVANERAMGLLTDESRSDRERLAAITGSGKPVNPALYEILSGEDDQ
jgi:hypothetical protein